MIKSDTIVAAATAHGHAGIAVVRISGNKALDLARKIFGSVNKNACPVLKHGRVFPGAIYWKGQLVDRVLGTVFKAPRSYTGEDTFEISCHGNPLVVEKVLRCAIESGARPANPGEFTRRAFLNNKMDLVQAEAVAHLIHADSDQAYRIALDHLQGTLSQRYTLLKEKLTSLLCGIEAAIDFPEEEVPLFNPASGKKELAFIKGIISAMIASYQTGKKIAQGVRVAIIGPPNAGKSSLFNALCEKERVIVHEHPGTTRDTVEETITIEGMKITLIDTAGIWKSSNPVEARGIARAKDAAKRADLSLVVFDAGKPCAKNEAGLFSAISTSERIVVCNKADLKHVRTCHGLLVSAKTGQGITRLKKMIMSRIVARTSDGAQEILVSERQRDILTAMAAHIDSCMSLAKNQGGEELYAFELRQALNLLGRITGDVSDDDILNTIFNTFCIGK